MDTFQALADPTRRHIIEMLASRGKMSATEIFEKFPISPPAVSQHLQVLRAADVVTMQKHAQKHIYEINTQSLQEIVIWIGKMKRLWNERFDALEKVLRNEKPAYVKTSARQGR